MKLTMSGGNFGGVSVTVPDGTSKIVVHGPEAGDFWVYDSLIHPQTQTADFTGMVDSSNPVCTDSGTVNLDMLGV